MPKVILLYASWCHNCPKAEKIWRDLKEEHDFEYEEVDVESEEGKKIAQEYSVMAVPTTVIDGEVAFIGIPSKDEALESIK